MDEKQKHDPGEIILGRTMADVTPEDLEQARENLQVFAAIVLRICTRIAEERRQAMIRDEGGVDI